MKCTVFLVTAFTYLQKQRIQGSFRRATQELDSRLSKGSEFSENIVVHQPDNTHFSEYCEGWLNHVVETSTVKSHNGA